MLNDGDKDDVLRAQFIYVGSLFVLLMMAELDAFHILKIGQRSQNTGVYIKYVRAFSFWNSDIVIVVIPLFSRGVAGGTVGE